jgi:hypothetical protein
MSYAGTISKPYQSPINKVSLLCLPFLHAQPRLLTARQAMYDGLVKAHTSKAMDHSSILHVLAFAVETVDI